MPKLVDFHCHLDLYPDFEAVVEECDSASIYTLAVTTTPRAWKRNRELAANTRHVRVGLGLHPQLVASHGKDIAIWEDLLGEADYVGEVGLDASPQYLSSLPEQRRIFSRILKCCTERGGLVLSIHAVRSVSMVLDMIEQHLDLDLNSPVLHWFSGSAAEAKRAAALGCSFSINNQMLGKSKTNALLAAIPETSILTETDGPFTTISGRPNRPKDVELCVSNLAAALGKSPVETRRLVFENLLSLLAKKDRQRKLAYPAT